MATPRTARPRTASPRMASPRTAERLGATASQERSQAKNGSTAVPAKSGRKQSATRNGTAAAPSRRVDKQALLEKKKLIEKGPKPRSPHAERRLQEIKARLAEAKDLAFHAVEEQSGRAKDRLVVMVRDPYWLHAYWELSRRSIQRAEVAMGQHWHAARPVLRLHEVSRNGTTSAARQGRARHRNPRRREQLVHRRAESAQELPGGNRLPGPRQPLLLPRPQQRGEHAHARLGRHLRPQLGRGGQGVRSGLRHDRRLHASRRPTAT